MWSVLCAEGSLRQRHYRRTEFQPCSPHTHLFYNCRWGLDVSLDYYARKRSFGNCTLDSKTDHYVQNCYGNPPSNPLNLPIASSRHTLPTQHLRHILKYLWMKRIKTARMYQHIVAEFQISVFFAENEMSECCVWIQCKKAGILQKEKTNTHSVL